MPTYSSELMKWEEFFNSHDLWGKTITLSHGSPLLSKHPRPFWVTFSLAHPKYHIWVLKYFVVIQVVMLTLCDPMDCRLPCISLYPRVCLNSCPLSQWCHATISFSVAHFFCFWSFPLSESFPMCWLFISGDQGMGALVSVLPMTFQGWFPLGINGWISLLSKRLSRVFSSTTVQKHQLSGPQPLYGATLTSILYYWKNRSFD